MSFRLAALVPFAAILALAFPVGAQDVCTEFLEEHPDDPAWETACLEYLESIHPGEPTSEPGALAQSQSAEGGQSEASSSVAIGVDGPVNMSNGDTIGEAVQEELFIAIDPNDAMRLLGASKTGPVFDRLFSARSDDGGDEWTPAFIAEPPGEPPAMASGGSDP